MLELRMFGSFAMLRRKWTTTGSTMLTCLCAFGKDMHTVLRATEASSEQTLFIEGFAFGWSLEGWMKLTRTGQYFNE